MAAEETPVAAFIDLVGRGYVELALELGIARDRIDTIVDFPAIQKYGVKTEGGAAAASAATLAELAEAIAAGDLVVPIQRTYPLDEVRAAFTELEAGHVAGKIVLIPDCQGPSGQCGDLDGLAALIASRWPRGDGRLGAEAGQAREGGESILAADRGSGGDRQDGVGGGGPPARVAGLNGRLAAQMRPPPARTAASLIAWA